MNNYLLVVNNVFYSLIFTYLLLDVTGEYERTYRKFERALQRQFDLRKQCPIKICLRVSVLQVPACICVLFFSPPSPPKKLNRAMEIV